MEPLRKHNVVSVGPRAQARINTLEQKIERWKLHDKKLCEGGQRIFELREDAKLLEAKRKELREARELKALAAAGMSD